MRWLLLAISLFLAGCNPDEGANKAPDQSPSSPPRFNGLPATFLNNPRCAPPILRRSPREQCVVDARYRACNCETYCQNTFGRPPNNSSAKFDVVPYNQCMAACNAGWRPDHDKCFSPQYSSQNEPSAADLPALPTLQPPQLPDLPPLPPPQLPNLPPIPLPPAAPALPPLPPPLPR